MHLTVAKATCLSGILYFFLILFYVPYDRRILPSSTGFHGLVSSMHALHSSSEWQILFTKIQTDDGAQTHAVDHLDATSLLAFSFWIFGNALTIHLHTMKAWRHRWELFGILWSLMILLLTECTCNYLLRSCILEMEISPVVIMTVFYLHKVQTFSVAAWCSGMSIGYRRLWCPWPTRWKAFPKFMGSKNMIFSTLYITCAIVFAITGCESKMMFLNERITPIFYLAVLVSLGQVAWSLQ